MNVADTSILITGANRGIGRALLDETLRRGAKKVHAETRGAFHDRQGLERQFAAFVSANAAA